MAGTNARFLPLPRPTISYFIGMKHLTDLLSKYSLAFSSLPKVALIANHDNCSSSLRVGFSSTDIWTILYKYIPMAPRKMHKQTHFQGISIHQNIKNRIHYQMNFRVWRTHAVHFPQEMDINTLQRYTLLLKKTIFYPYFSFGYRTILPYKTSLRK